MRIVCQQTILMKYHALFAIFEKKQHNLKLPSDAKCRWRFKDQDKLSHVMALLYTFRKSLDIILTNYIEYFTIQ